MEEEGGQIGLLKDFTMGEIRVNQLQIDKSYLHAKSEPSRMKNYKVMAKLLGS